MRHTILLFLFITIILQVDSQNSRVLLLSKIGDVRYQCELFADGPNQSDSLIAQIGVTTFIAVNRQLSACASADFRYTFTRK